MKDPQRDLRRQLAQLLTGHHAHLDFDSVIDRLPPKLRGVKPRGLPYSPWRLLEHLRIAQRDILEYSRDSRHVSPEWPGGYWPAEDAPASDAAWQASVKAFRADLLVMRRLVVDPATDLLKPLAKRSKHTILREALLLADHNAYHLGQMVLLRRLLGAWPKH